MKTFDLFFRTNAHFFRLLSSKIVLLICAAIFPLVESFAQCSAEITLTYPQGKCGAELSVLVYVNGDAESITLYEKVGGWNWQQIQVSPNDAPPIQFNFSITQATTYGVTYTAIGGGCESPLQEFTLSPMLSSPSVSGNTHICYNQSTTLTASGGDSYRWYDGFTLVSDGPAQFNTPALTSSKTYNVYAVSGDCQSTNTAVL
ncbi:MAG TPA: hypothetical protein VFU05_11605, partial [Cyclobacteriaceae bacterium]|nr:hypothetical protein [Cyclobacteriaceae bacterium]